MLREIGEERAVGGRCGVQPAIVERIANGGSAAEVLAFVRAPAGGARGVTR